MRVVLLAGVLVLSTAAGAPPEPARNLTARQAPPNPPAKASIGAMSWLAGTWEAATPASYADERWTPAAGGTMMGVSRTVHRRCRRHAHGRHR